MATVMEMQEIKKHRGMGEMRVAAVNGDSFRIVQTEMVAISGPHGSGKSSRMNSVSSPAAPTRGAYILDELISDMSGDEQAAIRKMLSQLDSSLKVCAALAKDMLDFIDETPAVKKGLAAN